MSVQQVDSIPERVPTITRNWPSIVIVHTYHMTAVCLGTPANKSVTLQHKYIRSQILPALLAHWPNW